MRRLRQAILLLVSLPLAVSAADESGIAVPDPTCAELVARRVQEHYDSVRDLSASFEQTVRSTMSGLGGDAKSSGKVVFSKPGRMRWSYLEPQPSEVISDGSTLWLYDPVAREAQKLLVTQGYLAGAGLQFLLGEGELLREFAVTATQCGAEGQTSVELELLPRAPASFERMRLRVVVETGEVEETTVVDLFGNETRIQFSDRQINRDPAPETFQFEAPEGVEVIDLVLPN